jgi:hypothetical protein
MRKKKVRMTTTIENRTSILSDLWLNYRNDDDFTDFVSYNDIGLPLAYAIANGIVETTDLANTFITETFDLLLAGLEIEDSESGFETLDDLFAEAG